MREPLVNLCSTSVGSGICLNMIVKNESAVIERLLCSVFPFLDSYLIVDTGSADGTPEIIHQFMKGKGISGQVHFRAWINFGVNRQQALDLAVANLTPNWLLFIDADEELKWTNDRWHTQMKEGMSYRIEKEHGPLRYELSNIIWAKGVRWSWHGAVHEYLDATPSLPPFDSIRGVWIHSHIGEGARSLGVTESQKFLKDAELLEESLRDDPSNARDRFYLAQSYRDAGDLRRAYENYGIRFGMGGWDEEVYVAQCERANLSIRLGMDHSQITMEHLQAYAVRPTRAEALWQLSAYCRENGKYAEGYLYSKVGKDITRPDDILFVRNDVYEWRLLDEFSICAYWIGQYQESLDASEKIMSQGLYDASHLDRLKSNICFTKKALGV